MRPPPEVKNFHSAISAIQIFLENSFFIFHPGLPDGIFANRKIPIWVYFGGPWSGNCLYILWPFGICYGH
jgi:hypothetical protein